jgi:hypothetical protein
MVPNGNGLPSDSSHFHPLQAHILFKLRDCDKKMQLHQTRIDGGSPNAKIHAQE